MSIVSDLRGFVEFLTANIDHRSAPAYAPPLRALLMDVPTLLDIAEAVAAMEPYEPAIGERYELECLFCSELGDRREDGEAVVTHGPDCAKAKADALCGKDADR